MTRFRRVPIRERVEPQATTLFDAAQPPIVQPEVPHDATLEERFLAFHAANPWVLAKLEEMTRELVDRGRTHIGIAMLFEVLRWNYYRSTDDPTSEFKLNNSYRAGYARLLLRLHPEWGNVFELRASQFGTNPIPCST